MEAGLHDDIESTTPIFSSFSSVTIPRICVHLRFTFDTASLNAARGQELCRRLSLLNTYEAHSTEAT